jgi:hypothetical protein
MKDKRWTWGNKYIQLKHDATITSEQKIGILNKQGWTASILDNYMMIKRFDFNPDEVYPDYGSNNEVYVNEHLLEIETLGPLSRILPGQSISHSEDWYISTLLCHPDTEAESSIDDHILPVINSIIR